MARLKAVVDECLLVAQAFTEISSDTYNELGAIDFEDNDKLYPFFLFDKRSIDGTVESFTRESLPKVTNYSQRFYFFNTYTEGEKPSTDLQTKEDELKEIADKYFAELRVRNQSGENGFFLIGRPTFNVVDETHNERVIQISYTLEIQTLPDNCELGTFVYNGLDKPTTLVATAISTSQIDLSWVDNATAETNYEVFRSLDCTNFSLLNTLPANTSYLYKVRAITTLSNGEFSNVDIACAGSSGGITPAGILYKRVLSSANTTSYRTGDDADIRSNSPFNVRPSNPANVAELDHTDTTPFLTLLENNAFGNLDRFTDDTGAQIYSNNYIIDHLTGLAWIKLGQTTLFNWNDAIDSGLSATDFSFNDYFLPNIKQLQTLFDSENGNPLNYTPFNTTLNLWTSTTRKANTLQSWVLNGGAGIYEFTLKTNTNRRRILCRYHY